MSSTSSRYRGRSVTSWCSYRENGCVPAEAISASRSAAATRRRARRPRRSSIASATEPATFVATSTTDWSSSGFTRPSCSSSSATSERISSTRETSS